LVCWPEVGPVATVPNKNLRRNPPNSIVATYKRRIVQDISRGFSPKPSTLVTHWLRHVSIIQKVLPISKATTS
jgi:hypothetical protein